MSARSQQLLRGLREDLRIARAHRAYCDRAFASGKAKATDYVAAVKESDAEIARLEAAIARHK